MAFDDALIGTDDFDPQAATEDLIRRTAGGPLPKTLSPNMLNTRLARKLQQPGEAPRLKLEDDDAEEKPAKGAPLDFSQQAVPAPTDPGETNPDFSSQATDPNAKPAAPVAQPGIGVSGNAVAAIKGVPVGAAQAIGGAIKGAGQALGNAQPTPAETYAAAGIDPQTLAVPPTRQELETPAAKNPDNAITRAGQAILKNPGDLENVYREKLGLPAKPPLMSDEEKASIGGTIGQMAGGVAPYAAIAAVNAPLGIAAGFAGMAADTYGSTYDDAKKKGASDEQAETAARNSALVAGALGSLPLGAGKLAKSLIAKAATSAAAFTTLGEAQEWALQEIAKGYDKDAGYTPEAKRIIAELILGAGMGGLHGLGGRGEEAATTPGAAPGESPAGALPGAGAAGPQPGGPGAGPQPRGFTGRTRYDAGNAWWERERTDGTWEQWVPPGAQHPGSGSAGAGAGPGGGPQPGAGPAGGGAGAQPPPGGGTSGGTRGRTAGGTGQQQSGPPPGTGEGKTKGFQFADAAMRAKMERIYRHFEPGKNPADLSDDELYNAVNEHLRDTSATGAQAQEDTAEEKAQREAHQKRKQEDEILKSAGWTDAHVNAMSEEQRARYVNEILGHQARAQSGPQPGAQQQRQAPPEQPAPPPKAAKAAKVEEPPAAAGTPTGTREAPIVPKTADDVTKALAAEPTPAQATAGNYQHAHMELPHLGLEGEHGISTETGVGQTRISTDADGKTHEVRMQGGAYGYIKGTKGADGDHLDIKIGPHPQSPYVFVIDQHDPQTGKFDELKVMAGYRTPLDAMHGYAIDYDDQAEKRIGHVTAMTADEFKTWLKKGDHTKGLKPAASSVSQGEAAGQAIPLTEAPAEGPVAGVPKVSPERGNTGVSTGETTASQEGSKPHKLTRAGTSTGSQEPLSLLQFIASKGGLKPHPELEAMDLRGNHRVQLPGRKGFFGVVRPTGDDLDRMREKAEEAGYLRGEGQKTSTVRDLLDAIDNELRGQRHAAEGEEGHKTRRELEAQAEREAHEHGKAQELIDELNRAGHGEIGPDIKARVLKLMAVHGMDPDTAIDTALIQLDAEEGIEPEQIDATFGPGAHDEANVAATYGHGAPGAPEGAEGERREAEAPDESRARAPDQGEAAGEQEPEDENGIPLTADDITGKPVNLGTLFRGAEGGTTAKDSLRPSKNGDLGSGIYLSPSEQVASSYGGGPKASVKAGTRKVHEFEVGELKPEEVAFIFGGKKNGENISIIRGDNALLWRGPYSGKNIEELISRVGGIKAVVGTPDSVGINQIAIRDPSVIKTAVEEAEEESHETAENQAGPTPDTIHGRRIVSSQAETNQLTRSGEYEQDDTKAGKCYSLSGKYAKAHGGTYTIATMGRDEVYHAVVTEDHDGKTFVYDPTMKWDGWLEASQLARIANGFRPVRWMTGDEVRAFGKETGYYPDPATLKLPPLSYWRTVAPGEPKRKATAPIEEKGADNKPQLVMPGAEQAPSATMAKRAAATPLKPKVAQKSMDVGMFGTEKDQVDMIDMIRSTLKKDADKVEPADIERAAEIKAQNPEMDVATAFGRAVVENAVDEGFLTKEEVIEAYGPQAETVLEPGREGTSRGSEPAEPQGAAPDEVRADHPEEARELPSGREAGGEGGANPEAEASAVEPAESAGATEPAAAGTRRVPANEAGNAAETEPAASAESPVENRPMSMAELGTMAQRIFEGRITADELKEGFRRAVASKDAITAELGKKTIKQLAPGGAGGLTKPQIIQRKFEAFLDAFNVHGGYSWSPFTETLEAALKRQVDKTTDADIAAARERRLAARAERQETYTNPQTLPQFESFIRVRGEDQLNSEQRKRYDELVAERNQAERAREQERSAKIAKVETPADMKLVETKHTQKGHDLFVVQMSSRVERETYDKLNTAAKKLGGYYSSYNKGGAVPGFQFKTREAAETFMAVKEGDVSRSALNAAKAEERQLNAVDNLRAQADTMTRAADELMNIDRKVNTARRASMAAGAEARAAADKALATSMRNIANAIESGEAKHLGFVRTRSEIEMLDRLLRGAKREWVEKRTKNYGEYTKEIEKPTTEEMVEGASYPYPGVHVEDAIRMATEVSDVNGAKMAARRVMKDAQFDQGEKRHRYVADNLGKQDDLRTVAEAMQKKKPSDYPAQTALESFADYARLRRIGINDLPSLRAALREYLAYRGKEGKADPIKAAERALIGRKIPGYFPTPDKLVDRMIEAADIKPGMKVLEPSAGKGNIADKLRAAAGEGNVDTAEIDPSLRAILEAKGHKLIGHNAMTLSNVGTYDRVVMNPPFEDGKDVLHVYQAYDMLAPGGRLVAIMSEHPFFAQDMRSATFRDWLKQNGGTSEKLPEGSFKESERSTGVNTRMVVINKPDLPGMEHFRTGRSLGDAAQAYSLAMGRKTGIEHLAVIGPDGRVHLAEGTKAQVDWPESVKLLLPKPGANLVAHHNHPSNGSFSNLDISALGLPGLHTLWAHGHGGNVYRAQLTAEAGRVLPENQKDAREKLFDRYNKTENFLFNPMQRYIRTGGFGTAGALKDLNILIGHLVNKVLADAGIIHYETNYQKPSSIPEIPGLSNAYKQAVIAAQRDFFHEPPADANDRYSYIAGHPGNVGTTLDRAAIDARVGPEAGNGEAGPGSDRDEEPRDVSDRGVTLGALGDPSRVLKEFKNFWTSTFQPELVTDRALTSDPLFARYKSAQAQEKDAIVRASESEWNYWNKKGDAARLDFLRRFERARYGVTFSSPTEEAMARRYRTMLDANWAEEQRWGSTASFVDDYMPHIWEKPGEWRSFSEAKSAQMGPTWFQKKRTIDYIDEGLAAGLKLKYTNPVDIVVHRLLSGVDMRMRMQLLYALKDEGLSWEGKQGGDELVRRGWRRLVAPDRKEWVIHPDAQKLWQNAVEAKGLWQDESPGGSMFRGWMALKNAWVPAKLAFSAFHPLHVQHINYADGMARGWDLLTKGREPVAALKAVADGFMRPIYSAPGAYTGGALGAIAGAFVGHPGLGAIAGATAGSLAFKGLKRAGLAKDVDTLGRRGRSAWHTRPNRQTPEQKALVSLMQDGGFVPQLSEQLKIAAKRQLAVSFQKALRREAGIGDYRRLISSAMRRPIEIMQAPIFERWIPELKTAAYLNAASDLLRRRPELWTNHNDRRLALRAIAKSIDNRFGEMFYGNLFWNRYVKDAGIASFLSMGWNLGFVREFGGAAFEAVSRPLGLIPGLKPSAPRKTIRAATNKIPFVIAYVASAALINGIMTALFTGEQPTGMDWIFARIGGQNPDGSPRRVTNMFYLREVPMLIKHVQERGGNIISGLGEMIWNKMMFEPFSELLNNRDYYGYNIWDENAPIYKQAWQAIRHTFGDQNPMALSGAQQAARLSGHEFPSPSEALEHPDRLLSALASKGVDLSILGFGPAPSYVEKSSIQNRIGYLYRQHVAPASKPNADEENSIEKMAVRTAIMIGKRDKDQDMLNLARERGRALGLSPKYMADIGKTPTDVYLFSRLPDADQRSLLAGASEEERARYLMHAHLKVRQEINRGRLAPQPVQ